MTDYLTVNEAAARLRVSSRTIRRWIASGELEAFRLPSGVLRIPETAVQAILPVYPKDVA